MANRTCKKVTNKNLINLYQVLNCEYLTNLLLITSSHMLHETLYLVGILGIFVDSLIIFL